MYDNATLEQRINKAIPVDIVRAIVIEEESVIEWPIQNLGITIKTKLKSTNLSNNAIERLIFDVGQQAKQLIKETQTSN